MNALIIFVVSGSICIVSNSEFRFWCFCLGISQSGQLTSGSRFKPECYEIPELITVCI